jgi:hypothetical protein
MCATYRVIPHAHACRRTCILCHAGAHASVPAGFPAGPIGPPVDEISKFAQNAINRLLCVILLNRSHVSKTKPKRSRTPLPVLWVTPPLQNVCATEERPWRALLRLLAASCVLPCKEVKQSEQRVDNEARTTTRFVASGCASRPHKRSARARRTLSQISRSRCRNRRCSAERLRRLRCSRTTSRYGLSLQIDRIVLVVFIIVVIIVIVIIIGRRFEGGGGADGRGRIIIIIAAVTATRSSVADTMYRATSVDICACSTTRPKLRRRG